jgi:hypothetical protein
MVPAFHAAPIADPFLKQLKKCRARRHLSVGGFRRRSSQLCESLTQRYIWLFEQEIRFLDSFTVLSPTTARSESRDFLPQLARIIATF